MIGRFEVQFILQILDQGSLFVFILDAVFGSSLDPIGSTTYRRIFCLWCDEWRSNRQIGKSFNIDILEYGYRTTRGSCKQFLMKEHTYLSFLETIVSNYACQYQRKRIT